MVSITVSLLLATLAADSHPGGDVKCTWAFDLAAATRSSTRRHHELGSALARLGAINNGEIIDAGGEDSIESSIGQQHPGDAKERGERSPSMRRRGFVSVAAAGLLGLAATAARADDPSNLYYKSKADEEDPLAVFGRSLQNVGGVDSGAAGSTPEGAGASLSLSDVALPSSSSQSEAETPLSSSLGGDLGQALREKKESQKRRVDPRTHG